MQNSLPIARVVLGCYASILLQLVFCSLISDCATQLQLYFPQIVSIISIEFSFQSAQTASV